MMARVIIGAYKNKHESTYGRIGCCCRGRISRCGILQAKTYHPFRFGGFALAACVYCTEACDGGVVLSQQTSNNVTTFSLQNTDELQIVVTYMVLSNVTKLFTQGMNHLTVASSISSSLGNALERITIHSSMVHLKVWIIRIVSVASFK